MKYREIVKRLKPYGIVVIEKRGKGSHRMLYQPSTRLNFPIKYHGNNEDYGEGYISALKRKFNLPDDF
jgi:predicted RNA binding protein YcfA (HicA-like mRNA interferase family)